MRARLFAPTGHDHRVTTFELFFDLVFVFAFTQVTVHAVEEHTGRGLLESLALLALLWWQWSAYAWLGNQVRADDGAPRVGMTVALVAAFALALAMPGAWRDDGGPLPAPALVVGAYLVVRVVHLVLYALAAGDDTGLRRQVLVTALPVTAGVVALAIGARTGPAHRLWWWLGALGLDMLGTWATARGGSWRLPSASHWAERHGLVVILALGESVVAVGVGAADTPLSPALVGAAALGVLLSTLLWWLYFDQLAPASEHALARLTGPARVEVGRDAYTYLHFPVVAGVVLGAVGVEHAVGHAADAGPTGTFFAGALLGGPALYLAGHAAFVVRVHRTVAWPRLVAAAVLLAAVPVAGGLRPTAALGVPVAVLAALVAVEATRYADKRRLVRPGDRLGAGTSTRHAT